MALTGLVFRLIKGSPLTNLEIDTNWSLTRNAFNALQSLFGIVLNPDGTLKNGAVGSTAVIADSVVTAAKLAADAKIPAGTILMYGAAAAPSGHFLCDGAAVNRTTYAALFAVIGTTWGAGDGTTTFNVPDLLGRAPIGAGAGAGLTSRTLGVAVGTETHALTVAEIPAHTHSEDARTGTGAGGSGGSAWTGVNTSGATGSTGGSTAHQNMMPSRAVTFIIKF